LVLSAAASAGVAQVPGFHLVGEGNGTNESYAIGFTPDGALAVGRTGRAVPLPQLEMAYRWTAQTGRLDAMDAGLQAFNTFQSVSTDGSVIVGAMTTRTDWSDRRSIVVRTGQPLQVLPILSGFRNVYGGTYVSGDGTVVVGTCQTSGAPPTMRGFRWTAASGIQAIPYPVANHNFARIAGISRDGTTVVGYSTNTGLGISSAFVWRAATGTVLLPISIPNRSAEANAVSADGSMIVGRFDADSGYRAVYWDAQREMHELEKLQPAANTESAHAVSDDGQVIVGRSGTGTSATWRGCVWTIGGGVERAEGYCEARGAPFPAGYVATVCDSVSGNGRSIGIRLLSPDGVGNISGIAVVGVVCPADFNHDGGVDGADVESFFGCWSDGLSDADVNEDGGVDGADVELFFTSWEAGGC
jgi:uncharacterized membrane protein